MYKQNKYCIDKNKIRCYNFTMIKKTMKLVNVYEENFSVKVGEIE